MLGLDAAGKTTILYKLHIGEILSTVPTIGTAPYDLLWVPCYSCTCVLPLSQLFNRRACYADGAMQRHTWANLPFTNYLHASQVISP